MIARTGILSLTTIVALSAAAPVADAGSWGFSFGYRSSSPRCYSGHSASYARYGYSAAHASYYRPSTYRSVVVRDACAPVRHYTTYSRSSCYTSPRYYRSRSYHYSPARHYVHKRVVRSYPAPRAYRVERHVRPRVHDWGRHHRSHHRHYRPPVRVRVHRH